jgi:hypothetical protein
VELAAVTGAGGDATRLWDAEKDFTGPARGELDRWQQLAQVLLLANEFIFLD